MIDRNQDPVRIYLPHPESTLSKSIDHGSGIVGADAGDGRVLIYYEGNRFGAANLKRYSERVQHADGRFHADYPTIARSVVDSRELVAVGWWHRRERRVELDVTPDELSWWVDNSDPEQELLD